MDARGSRLGHLSLNQREATWCGLPLWFRARTMRYESGSPHRDHHHQVVVWVVAVLRMAGFIGEATVGGAAPAVNRPPSGNENHVPDPRDNDYARLYESWGVVDLAD